jgi:hypothetical protein
VLPLHHSRENQKQAVFCSVLGLFHHCKQLHSIACFESHFARKWVEVGSQTGAKLRSELITVRQSMITIFAGSEPAEPNDFSVGNHRSSDLHARRPEWIPPDLSSCHHICEGSLFGAVKKQKGFFQEDPGLLRGLLPVRGSAHHNLQRTHFAPQRWPGPGRRVCVRD